MVIYKKQLESIMFKTAADVGKGLRKQIVPMMKSKGFNLRVTTSKESYYHDGNVRVQITKVPTNFPVWIDEYSKWRVTPNAERLVQTIKERIGVLVEQLDIDVSVDYDKKIPFIEYEEK
tara:strand:- start:759 stop:1115 length:357 start_codon:yes stop_codon:yes gene_type:complete